MYKRTEEVCKGKDFFFIYFLGGGRWGKSNGGQDARVRKNEKKRCERGGNNYSVKFY